MQTVVLIAFILFGLGECCLKGWKRQGNNCYKALYLKADLRKARVFCQLYDSDLALANTQEIIHFLHDSVIRIETESYWVNENSRLPDFPEQFDTCPYLESLEIKFEPCTSLKASICGHVNETIEDRSDLYCPPGWELVGSTCFTLSKLPAEQSKAAALCVLQGGRLANFDDGVKEHYARIVAFETRTPIWVAANKQDGEFKWLNGQPFRPSCDTCLDLSSGDCVLIQGDPDNPLLYKWKSTNCSLSTLYLCERVPMNKTTTTTVTTPATTTKLPLMCPHGYNWKSHEESGYCFWETTYEVERLNWFQARNFCQSYGGDLASYHSASEESSGVGGAGGHYKGMWIGLQRGEDNVFRWSDGTVVDYTNWDINQPRLSSRSKYCAAHSPLKEKWMLDYCGVRRWFVCRAPKVSLPTVPHVYVDKKVRCNVSSSSYEWWLYDNHCYMLHDVAKYTWFTARTFCQDNGGQLASIHSFNETNFILFAANVIVDSDYWMGLSSRGLHSPLTWADNSPVEFIYMNENVSAVSSMGINTCYAFDKREGSWTTYHCNQLLGVICKKPINSTYEIIEPEPTPFLPGFCPSGWYNLGNKCYKHFGHLPGDRKSWIHADENCKRKGGALVSIHSKSEQDFLIDLLLEVGTDVWTGLRGSTGGVLSWTDHSHIDFTNWGDILPDITLNSNVAISSEEDEFGRWRTAPGYKIKGYICERLKDPTLNKPSESPFQCPNMTNEWLKIGQSCYRFFDEQEYELTWLQAQATCRQYNSDLMSISNAGISIFLQRKLAATNYDVYWTGIREIKENQYQVLNRIEMKYTNWMLGQPHKISQKMDNCVAVNSEAKWMVRLCEEIHPFICEMRLDATEIPVIPGAIDENTACPNNSDLWTDFGSEYCYIIQELQDKTWGSAMFSCFKYGGVLASIHSMEENALIVSKLAELTLSYSDCFYIGLGKKDDGSYGWVDHTPVDFTNMDQYRDKPDSDCIYIGLSGTWVKISCSYTTCGYICSTPKVYSNGHVLPYNSSIHREEVEKSFAVGGIVGIVICLVVVFALIGVTIYYLCPPRVFKPQLLETDEL